MKMNLRILSLFLGLIMVLSGIPSMSVSADEKSYKIVTAHDLYYAYGTATTLASSLEKTDGGYIHCIASPGSYGDNDLKYSFFHPSVILHDMPYVAVGYRTNSQNPFVDLLQGANWRSSGLSQTTDGTWQKLIINVNEIDDNPNSTVPQPDKAGITVTLKPWKSHSKVLGNEQYYDVRYVGYFASEADAKAFVFDPEADYDTEISIETLENAPYYKADQTTIDKYTSEADALKDSIINSPSTVTWTGKTYYVSPKGDDNNDGLTPVTAFKSVSKVSGARFLKPGDAVLFERGGVFRCTEQLNTVQGVTYSAYGSGAKPKLVGAIDASHVSMWEETEVKNVYALSLFLEDIDTLHNDIGQIIFDNGKAWGIKLQDGHWIGTNSNGLEMIATGTPSVKGPEGVRHDLEFWYDRNGAKLYLYSKDGNPAERFTTVDVCPNINAIRFTSNNVIDNLEIYGYGRHGILAGSGTENVTVQYCVLSFIGGGIHWQGSPTRLGNAIQIYGTGAKNFTIHDCYAYQIYDCCFTVQYQDNSKGTDVIFDNIQMYNNVGEYSNTGLEVWVVNHARYNNPATFALKNMHLHNNYTLYSGYGWSQQRTNKNGNIFYGDPSETNTLFENCSVDHNVGIFASKMLNYVRYTGTEQYNFNNNVYFQHNNKLFGGVASNPNLGTGAVSEYAYDHDTMARLLATGFEPGSVFYYTESDYSVPLYSPEPVAFADVSEKHWAYDTVKASVMRGHFNGISQTEFAPDAPMTRAMVATVLSRISSGTAETEKAPYTDISANAWYINAVNFAYTNKLVRDDITRFRPDDAITREELADMLYRFTYNAYKTDSYENAVLSFPDASSVSPEYKAGVAFATDLGIISGYTDGTVRPNNTATRAEVATMLDRFLNKLQMLETDYSRLAKSSGSQVFEGEKLMALLNVASGDKVLTDDALPLLTVTPKPAGQGDPYPQISILERSCGFSFSEYPYIRLRVKTQGNAKSIRAKLTKGNMIGITNAYQNEDNWSDVILCVYDMLAPDSQFFDGTSSSKLNIELWNKSDAPVYGTDSAQIEYIGFFASKDDALKYESELERSYTTVSYYINGALTQEITVKKGSPLKYPENYTEPFGFKVTGWDVPEGTAVTDAMKVNAVLNELSMAEYVIFTPDNMNAADNDFFTNELKEENGISFIRFDVTEGKLSSDHTRAIVELGDEYYDVSEYPIMKLLYRTNINKSASIDFNIRPTENTRVWGPKLTYLAKNKWVEHTVDLRTLGWNGGEGGIEAGLTSSEYFERYFKQTLHSIVFKPYEAVGRWMNPSEYFDIAAIALFKDEKAAEKHSLIK
ncbi:MAG: S-layer homology domain-containing protein [Clostridia bacterium]|nr:S-layer homology domain-containing protein [Clostridia bacterium]